MDESNSPYILQPLLFPALPNLDSFNPTSPAATARAVRSIEGSVNHLYLGSSDGQVHVYSLSNQGSSTDPNQFSLLHTRSISSSNKPVERILLLEKVDLAVVQCESAITFYSLPDFISLDSSSSSSFPRIKGVASVVLDDEEILKQGGTDGQGMVSLCVVKRRSVLLLKCGKEGWGLIKEMPIANGVTLSRRYGDTLLFSDTSTYSLLNLSTSQLIPLGLPISQVTDSPTAQVKPSIVSIPSTSGGGCEFLITSHSTDMTLGVFITPSGEPSPKLLEWRSHPRSLAYDSPNLISLLRDNTLEVHDLSLEDLSLSRRQVIQLPDLLEPRSLSSGTNVTRIGMDDGGGEANLKIVIVDHFKRTDGVEDGREEEEKKVGASTTPARVLLAGRNVVQAICQPSFTIKAGRLLRRENWEELERLVGSEEMEAGIDEERPPALLYFHHVIALHHLKALRFARAARHYIKAESDFREVLRMLPEIWDAKTDASGTNLKMKVPNGLKKEVSEWESAEEMILRNLSLNYAPALDVKTNPSILRLKRLLSRRSREMVRRVLDASRTSSSTPADLLPLLETSLAKILSLDRDSDEPEISGEGPDLSVGDLSRFTVAAHPFGELLASLLISKGSKCDMEILEPFLKEKGRYNALAKWYEKEGRWEDMLEIWTKLIDGELLDVDFEPDPEENLEEVVKVLEKCDDSGLLNRYGIWVTQRDAERGVKILTRKTSKRPTQQPQSSINSTEDHTATLNRLRGVDPGAAEAFLEHMVLSRKQQVPDLHAELVELLLNRVLGGLKDEETRKAMLEIERDYSQGHYAESFVAHLALHASSAAPAEQKLSLTTQAKRQVQDSASSVSKVALERLKLSMTLQGSNAFDVDSILKKIEGNDLLAYEKSILLGKLGQHKEALSLLALSLRDANSSEAYCSQSGAVLSPMLAEAVAQDHGLKMYATLVSRGGKATLSKNKLEQETPQENGSGLKITADEKQKLLKTLLQVYMENGKDQHFQIATAHLLNTQALHLQPLDVLSLVPPEWSVSTLETFLSRSLRRSMHERQENQIVSALALAQNLEIHEQSFAKTRALGGILQEDEDEGDDEERSGEAEETNTVYEVNFNDKETAGLGGNVDQPKVKLDKELVKPADLADETLQNVS